MLRRSCGQLLGRWQGAGLALPSLRSLAREASTKGDGVKEINDEFEEVFGQKLGGETIDQHQGQQHQGEGALAGGGGGGVDPGRRRAAAALTHVDEATGDCNMVDVGGKEDTKRVATARAFVVLEPHVYDLVAQDKVKKGNVLAVAQIAGIQAAKKTSDLIPLCHNLALDKVSVDCTLLPSSSSVEITSSAKTTGKTGVEMEALTACSVAALTIYDMCKAASKATRITDISLLTKSGGKSGEFSATEADPRS